VSFELARIRCALSAKHPSWFSGCGDGMLRIDVGLQRAHLRPEMVSLPIQVETVQSANISLQTHCDRLHRDSSIIRLRESGDVMRDELPVASSPVANRCKMLSRSRAHYTASLLENWIDEAERRVWFLREADRN
jgi:hypothetical protein